MNTLIASMLGTFGYGLLYIALLIVGAALFNSPPLAMVAIGLAGLSYLTQAAETLRLSHMAELDAYARAADAADTQEDGAEHVAMLDLAKWHESRAQRFARASVIMWLATMIVGGAAFGYAVFVALGLV